MGQFLPADHSKGDDKTIGGWMAVHARPAAFEGSDGLSYTVEIEADETDITDDENALFAAYFLFVRWSKGDPVVTGHIETDYLEFAATPEEARSKLGARPLEDAKRMLDEEITSRKRAR